VRIFKVTQEDAREILDTLTSEPRHLNAERRRFADMKHGSIAWLITVFIIWNIFAILACGSYVKSVFNDLSGRTTRG
jgi:hypothetical protein